MPRLVYLVTHPMTADCFLRGHLAYMRAEGYEVHLISAPGPLLDKVGEASGATTHAIPFQREIRPWADLLAMLRLTRLIKALAPDLVNASTPKAGLLGLLAARWAGVPHRLYLLRGLRLETANGAKGRLLRFAERRAARAATRIYCVSASLRQRYSDLGLAGLSETEVLSHGSSNGVTIERFAAARDARSRDTVRDAWGVPPGSPVIGFVGRLTRDKGVADLVSAFLEVVLPAQPAARLVLLGDFEAGDPVEPSVRRRIEGERAIIARPFVPDLAEQYGAFDLVAFPSFREGFPNVPLEAAACGLPVAGYRATGTVDAVVDGTTGTLVEVGDWAGLGQAVLAYLEDPELRRRHGAAGLERAARDFRPAFIWQAWRREYSRLLGGPA